MLKKKSYASPVLANIYLHYVLDLWFEKAAKPNLKDEGHKIRFADDFICCFQYKSDAEQFYKALIDRLTKFGLEIAKDKSKIIMFGRFAEDNMRKMEYSKPETFDLLGFTHCCSRSRNGKFRVKCKTSKKKFKAKLKAFKAWIKENRHMHIAELFKFVKLKLIGHYRYYGITDNSVMIGKYKFEIVKLIFKWLNKGSQKKSFHYGKFNKYISVNNLTQVTDIKLGDYK